MRMNKLAIVILALALLLPACSVINAGQQDGVRAFGDVLAVLPPEGDGRSDSGAWCITAPDGSARFEWDNQSVDMFVDARAVNLPVREGVDPPTGLIFHAPAFNMLNQDVQQTPLAQFEKNLRFVRDYFSYDEQTGRYGIGLSDGAARFEWARDISATDKDIVFALNAALVSPDADALEKADGWVETDGPGNARWYIKSFNLT